jgi:hypothetical protein
MTEFQIALQKFIRYKPSETDQIPAEIIGTVSIKLHLFYSNQLMPSF